MNYLTGGIRWFIALAILIAVGAAFWYGLSRLRVDNDITAALPENDPVVAAARRIVKHHPALENVFVDISLTGWGDDRDCLADAADLIVAELEESGMVKVVTGQGGIQYILAMLSTVTENLPLFMREADLKGRVRDLLRPGEVDKLVRDEYRRLFELGNIGQAEYLAKDPLGLRNLVLARLSPAMPFQGGVLHRGHILTEDGKHLLIIAEPLSPAHDTSFARRMTEVLENAMGRLEGVHTPPGTRLKMVYVGAFRAALDNELIIRSDISRALTVVMIGLALLILVSFRRPWIGILAGVPAVAGVMLATFAYSLIQDSIFALSIGFGGALISIAVDHGLAYVLLLDRPYETRGLEVSGEVWSVASFTVLTTVAAMLCLAVTGIPLLTEVGLFAALGVGLAAFFVHMLFPILFPTLKGSKRVNLTLMERLMSWLNRSSSWRTVAVFTAVALAMLFFIKFEFSVDLASMNTMSPQSLEAEQTIDQTWGNLSNRLYIMATGRTEEKLWREAERLRNFLEREKSASILAGDIPRAIRFPGPKAQEINLNAWQAFWTPERVMSLVKNLDEIGSKLKFRAGAFQPFLEMVREPKPGPICVPSELYAPLGMFKDRESDGWLFVGEITPGPAYRSKPFFERADRENFSVFDPGYFSRHLAGALNTSFVNMLLIIGGIVIFLLFFLFVDLQLLMVSLTPLAFSLIATLGTMGLLGLPLSIPSLMLAPVLIGLGMDYGLYLVRSYQRFGAASHPSSEAFRVAILLGGLSTLIGMGSLVLSGHAVLRSAGVSTFLGIFYSIIGTFGIIPPMLHRLFASEPNPDHQVAPGSKEHTRLALSRFKHLEPHPRLFARFKVQLDPMFPRLADFVKPGQALIDVGCGYGVPAAWLLALYSDLRIIACEPSKERARIAARVLLGRAKVLQCRAIDLPSETEPMDAVLLLDMLHYLTNEDLEELLSRLKIMLNSRGRLIIRVTIPEDKFSFQRWVETTKMRLKGLQPYFRSEDEMSQALNRAGFKLELVESTASGREETWFIARAGI